MKSKPKQLPKGPGPALERATEAIAEMVLRAHPDIGEGNFTVQKNVHFQPYGDDNEIDLLVKIYPGEPRELRHIFECKNCKKPVSKSDVVIFAAKVKDLPAHKGTIVARKFSQDARARAKHEGVDLEQVSAAVWLPLGLALTVTSFQFQDLRVTVHRRGKGQDNEPNWASAVCRFQDGRLVPFYDFVRAQSKEWAASKPGALPNLPGGAARSDKLSLVCDPGELFVGDWEIDRIDADFTYTHAVRPAVLKFTFSIEKKGRFAEFLAEPDPYKPDEELAVQVLGKP